MVEGFFGVCLPRQRRHLGDQAGRKEGLSDCIVQFPCQATALLDGSQLLGLLVQARVLDGDRRLIGHGLEHLQIALVEGIQLVALDVQYADDASLINTGHYGAGPGSTTKTLAKYIGGCGAGRCYCAVQPNGDITPCVFMPLVVGNVRRDDFMNVWENCEVFKQLRDRSTYGENCVSCDYKYYCGGCRARSYGYFGDFLGPDPGCINNRESWQRLKANVAEAASL